MPAQYQAPGGGAVQGAAFILVHSALCAFFPTHKYLLTLFEPIPIGDVR